MEKLVKIFPSLKTLEKPKGVDWNTYRKLYPSLSFKELESINKLISELYPVQRHYKPKRFCDMLGFFNEPLKIVEIGCNDGSLAEYVLNYSDENIELWHGYDFSHSIKDIRKNKYQAFAISDRYDKINYSNYNTFVSSHTIEHLSDKECFDLILSINGIKNILIEVPLNADGRTWHNWGCTHVLSFGMDKLNSLICGNGYSIFYEKHPDYGYIKNEH